MTSLVLEDVSVERSGFTIVRKLKLQVAAGSISLLLGPNGAGKTTLLEAISGILPCKMGQIMLNGEPIERMSRVERFRRKLAHVEQGRTVFGQLSVEENLLVAGQREQVEAAYTLFPELQPRRHIAAGMLSGGEQQMLVLARALIGQPRVLLIDELSLGLAPRVVQRLLSLVRRLADEGMAIVLVEQFAHLALQIGDRAYILNHGALVYAGGCTELRAQPMLLQQAYMDGYS